MNKKQYGPNNNIQGINNRVIELDKITIIGIEFEVIEIPGHTLDHIPLDLSF